MEFGNGSNTDCDLCGDPWCDLNHILWQCPHFMAARIEVDEKTASIEPRSQSKIEERDSTGNGMQERSYHLGTRYGHQGDPAEHKNISTRYDT